MKMTDRIKRNMQPAKAMTLISLRLPNHVIDDLKEVAPSMGSGGYQVLIRAYISNGLRNQLAEREAQRAKDSTVDEFSQRLIAHGVPEQAMADMRAGDSVAVPVLVYAAHRPRPRQTQRGSLHVCRPPLLERDLLQEM